MSEVGASTSAASPPPKADPETLVIRAKPERAIRFRRGLIIGIAAVGSVSLMAVTWIALKPPVFRQIAAQEELSEPTSKASSDALNSLPATYGDAPKLGPPLPGDLGRPILEHQRALAREAGASPIDPLVQAAHAERERQRAELKASRESGILVQSRSAIPGPEAGTPLPQVSPRPEREAKLALDPNAQHRKPEFVNAPGTHSAVNPHRLSAPLSPYVLSAGSVIPASLITGLRSDLPGLVTAQVTSHVYDSPSGQILLIPQGSRLVGSYDSVVAFGQKRALIVWQRIILPDGSSLMIDNVPAADASGYAGLQDKVDFHTWTLLKGIALSTLLGIGSELALSGESDIVQALRRSSQGSSAQSGDQITARNLDIQPTITVRPGAPVRLVVHKDLVLAPWRG